MTFWLGLLVVVIAVGLVLEWRARTAVGAKRRKSAKGLAGMVWAVAAVNAVIVALVALGEFL